ncbi:MAG: YfhO family protein, partial [Limisphaerales bacterium]
MLAALTGVLALLFARSFSPEYIVFANDGPLGATTADCGRMPGVMFGLWQDLNWVGNEGLAAAPSPSSLLTLLLSPVMMAKIIVPLSLLLLGCAAWVFFRQCGFEPWVCAVGGIAAALNGDRFSIAAWGLCMWVLSMASVFLALAALMAASRRRTLVFTMLAGFATGVGVMEGFDTGAIFSLVVGMFAAFLAWATSQGSPGLRLAQGAGRVALVAVCAAFIATYSLGTLIGTQVKGVVGMAQDKETREHRYVEATVWSLPKIETLRVLIPGLFGYRMDSPDGGAYWGTIGQNPAVAQLSEAAARGDAQARAALANPALHRHSGSGEYAGVLVVLLAVFALVQAFRQRAGAFTDTERRLVWFWGGVALVSLLFAFGKYAPFYKLFYSLPYASTIRNPVKFMHPFHLAMIILCGYGLQAIASQFVKPAAAAGRAGLAEHMSGWWGTVTGFERRWTLATLGLAALGMLGLLLYGSSRKELEKHLVSVAFSEDMAGSIASHSIGEVGWFVLFFALSAGAVAVAFSGYWSGARARWAGVTLGLLLTVDLARANAPWIVYWNYLEKYAGNPIIDILKQSPHEHRVQSLPFQVSQQFGIFQQLYGMEWTQHLFLYNNIQTLDITQESRPTVENKTYREALLGRANTLARLWELTNTRYLFGVNDTNFLKSLAAQLDPGQNRFRVHTAFDIVPKPGVGNSPTRLDQVTVATNGPGQFALIEFTGALPRAKLFTSWLTTTNDTEVLSLLTNATFKPHETVIVSAPLPAAMNAQGTNAGTVKFLAYAPRRVRLEANATAPAVLLLNDKHSPNWNVAVDGKPATLLRCNYLMRGVQVPAGRHEIEFRYEPPITGLYVTMAAIVVALGLLVLVLFTRRKD